MIKDAKILEKSDYCRNNIKPRAKNLSRKRNKKYEYKVSEKVKNE
jgi:hypothetical protein